MNKPPSILGINLSSTDLTIFLLHDAQQTKWNFPETTCPSYSAVSTHIPPHVLKTMPPENLNLPYSLYMIPQYHASVYALTLLSTPSLHSISCPLCSPLYLNMPFYYTSLTLCVYYHSISTASILPYDLTLYGGACIYLYLHQILLHLGALTLNKLQVTKAM